MANERRKAKFIDSWAQLLIALEILLHSLLLLSLVALILFSSPFVTLFSSYSLLDHQAVAKEFWIINSGKWPLFVILLIFIGFISILFSHQIVGPAAHIRRVLNSMKNRSLKERIRLRKYDYLRDLETPFNETVNTLRTDFAKIKKHQEDALQSLNEGAPNLEKVKENLHAVKSVLDEYDGIVGLEDEFHPGVPENKVSGKSQT